MKFVKYLILLLISLSLIASCSNNRSRNGIIDKSTFINVLVDIHMADAILTVQGYRITSDSTNIRLFYNDVLLKHKVTQKQIENTFKYYTNNPRQFESVYEEVSEKIVKREEEYDKSIELSKE